MLEDIKKIQGISHNEFDIIIQKYIDATIADLIVIGIKENKVNEEDKLIYSAILANVLSFLDVNNSEMYKNSYNMQKNVLRHLTNYKETDE